MEIDTLATPWMNARVAHLLLVHRMTAMKVGDGLAEESSSDELWPGNVHPKCRDYRGLFLPCGGGESRKGLHWRTYQCHEALQTEDSSLLQGLTVKNTYTWLRQGSKKAFVVVRNTTAYPQILWNKTPVARAVTAILVPKPPMEAQLQGRMSLRILIPPN